MGAEAQAQALDFVIGMSFRGCPLTISLSFSLLFTKIGPFPCVMSFSTSSSMCCVAVSRDGGFQVLGMLNSLFHFFNVVSLKNKVLGRALQPWQHLSYPIEYPRSTLIAATHWASDNPF